MPDHEERPPSTLAHGVVKSGDIERVRRDVDESEAQLAHDKKRAAARKEQQLRRKDTPEADAEN
jgi:multidrug resistance efflux pump